MYIHQYFLPKEPKIYNGERNVSLVNGGGKTGKPDAKEQN